MIDSKIDHVGVVVPRLEPALEQLSATFGLEWLPGGQGGAILLMHRPNRDSDEQIRIRAAQTVQYPRIEVVEAVPGTPWVLEGTGGFLLHHVAYWTSDLVNDSKQLSVTAPLQIYGVGRDGASPKTFTYQLLDNGLLFELLEEQWSENGDRVVDQACVLEV